MRPARLDGETLRSRHPAWCHIAGELPAGRTAMSLILPFRPAILPTDLVMPVAMSPSGNAAVIRVIPGSYLARQQPDGSNPGAGFIRLALVADSETTAEALHRLVEILD